MSDPNPMPAFPQPFIQNERGIDFPFDGYGMGGISMRDYFAAKALNGFLSNSTTVKAGEEAMRQLFATCYQVADAMLSERAKGAR